MSNRKNLPQDKVERDSTKSAEFLLLEYEQLEVERVRLRNEAVNRLNVFLTLTSALLGGIVLFGQSSTSIKLEYIILIALGFLLIVGWEFHRFMISRDIHTDLNLRAQARIRRYFVHNDPAIERHITWQVYDEPFKSITNNTSGIRRTSQSILAFLIAGLVCINVHIFFSISSWVIISASISAFIISVILLEFFAQRKFKRAVKEANQQIRFPRPKS